MRHTPSVIVVLVSCPTRAVARRLSLQLVKQRLAACVNTIPGIESMFTWQEKTEHCREVLLLIKTTTRRFERLRQTILSLHPYDVPEILALPVQAGHQPYLRWVSSSLSS